jgi:hypothetical protein
LKFLTFIYEIVKVSDSTNAALPQVEFFSDVCCEQLAVTEFLVANKESVTSIQKSLCIVDTSAVVDRSILGHWVKRVMASEREKVELFDLPHSGHPVTAGSPEMLPYADATVCREQCITPDSWCSFLQSAEEVLVIHNLCCLKVFARCVPWNLAVKHKTKRKTTFFKLLVC